MLIPSAPFHDPPSRGANPFHNRIIFRHCRPPQVEGPAWLGMVVSMYTDLFMGYLPYHIVPAEIGA
jgi:hypothetical protein